MADWDEETCRREIQNINSFISALTPPALTVEPPDISTEQDRVKKGPHCKTCGHSTKGHRKADQNKACNDCLNQICSESGKNSPCKCSWHMTQRTETQSDEVPDISDNSSYPAQSSQNHCSNAPNTSSTANSSAYFSSSASSQQVQFRQPKNLGDTIRTFFLHSDICQGKVDNRYECHACKTICVLMAKLGLQKLLPPLIERNQISPSFLAVFKVAMIE